MRTVLLIGISACGLLAAADAPYAGKWKMNLAKSDFGESTATYEKMSGGEMKMTMDGQSYTFKSDAKENRKTWGMTMSWNEADPPAGEVTEKTNGKVPATSTIKLSSDGAMLTIDGKRTKADGGTSTESMSFQRVSGGPGLAG